ncbi:MULTISPECIES: rhodanese-like domain-containing protein [Shewanella]|uniref:rhodanese-like domain-containing protein n=1 Tax=Shewanella TaxID=22 RepID=UPI000F4D54CD|nr:MULTISPECIES: rhodanese-like domain-containing protein [Shewanella]MBB1427431.1 rhodanese-like domain-containing protein [Shewanella sp. SG44-2]RPA23502.1 rhodanese-like domain-containing protein [Shewanella frigidimarina]
MNAIEFFEAKMQCTISPMDCMSEMKKKPDAYVVVDVRNAPAHIRKEKIQGALEIAQIDLEANLDKLDKDKTIIVYCWETWCNLAAKSAVTLINNGYNVKELGGGIAAWNTLNLPTEQL